MPPSCGRPAPQRRNHGEIESGTRRRKARNRAKERQKNKARASAKTALSPQLDAAKIRSLIYRGDQSSVLGPEARSTEIDLALVKDDTFHQVKCPAQRGWRLPEEAQTGWDIYMVFYARRMSATGIQSKLDAGNVPDEA